MKVKYIVIPAVAILLGGLYYKSRLDNVKRLVSKVKAVPTGIRLGSNPFANNKFKCFIDVTLFNETSETFNADGILSFLKRINIITQGKRIATINVNKSSLKIPPRGQFVLKNLELEISLVETLLNFKTLTNIKSVSDIRVEPVISILGNEQTIS